MDHKAIAKAESRLAIAKRLLAELNACSDYPEFCGKWYLFLVAAKNVYTTLEKGARDNAKTRQWWFASKKDERKDDPLLQYLFQARDDDEHGLEPVTQYAPGGIAIGARRAGYSNVVELNMSGGQMHVRGLDGLPVLIKNIAPRVLLVPVTARGGIKYDPPTTHLGKSIGEPTPVKVADLGVAYLVTLLEEARLRAS